jgi:hypothetical protein
VIFNTIGDKTLTATYSGDANYESSLDTEPHSVRNATTTTITSDNSDPSFPGDAVTVSVTVSGAGVPPTGNVDIIGADTNCSFALAGGSGSCNVTFLTAGAKVLTATYAGDANYVGSVGTASHTVDRGPLTVFTMGGLGSSAPFALVTVTVNVNGAGVIPTGTVAISGATTECTITLASGTGSCDVMFDLAGAYTVTATYSGDGNYLSSFITGPHNVP